MPSVRTRLGDRGEALAASHLEAAGYRIVGRNYRTRYGEIDLIAEDGETVVFVEVRTKRSVQFGAPEESVTLRKYRRLVHVAEQYLQAHGREQADWRIDLVAIMLHPPRPTVTHIQAISF